MKHKELNLDKLIISEKENNFYFASKKLEDALFKSLDKYFDWYLKNIKQKTICHDALIISKPKIIADLISIFSIDYTLNISKKTKTDLSKNPSSWLINDFMSKNFYPPNLSLLINRVMPVPEKISSGQISENFRYFIDFMKKILNPKATNIKKSSKKFIKNNDILCFVCDENVRSFFDKEDVFVVSNWKFWFNKSINSEKKIIIENLSKEISNEFTLNMIKKLNLKSSELAKLHLKKTVCLYIQKISEMMEKVKFNAEYIPKTTYFMFSKAKRTLM